LPLPLVAKLLLGNVIWELPRMLHEAGACPETPSKNISKKNIKYNLRGTPSSVVY